MKITLLLLILLILCSCGSSLDTKNMTADELFSKGKEYYTDEEYLDAQKMFDLIKLQYPASQFADDAQYFLAELDFQREKFILAAFNYNSLRRIYPSSEYNKQSLFMRSLCYYNLSPGFERDQEYTKKAIESFKEFNITYPNDSLSTVSNDRINELRTKLAKREFSTAELYSKLDDPKAALVYYDFVINQYNDTEYYQEAYLGKVKSLVKMKKQDEAENIVLLYNKSFPNGEYKDDMQNLLSQKDED